MDARLALNSPIDATTEEDVDADSVRETVSHWEFLVGDVVVQRFPKNWLTSKPRTEDKRPPKQSGTKERTGP